MRNSEAWALSSVGQSIRLITGRSRVRIPEGPPRKNPCDTLQLQGLRGLLFALHVSRFPDFTRKNSVNPDKVQVKMQVKM